jgi:hypothetical protein
VVQTAKKQHDETLELLAEINLLKRTHTWVRRSGPAPRAQPRCCRRLPAPNALLS